MKRQLTEIQYKAVNKSKLMNIFKGSNNGKTFKNQIKMRESILKNNENTLVNHSAKRLDVVIYDHLVENQPLINCGSRLTKKHIDRAKRMIKVSDDKLILITDFNGADDLAGVDIGIEMLTTAGAIRYSAVLIVKDSVRIDTSLETSLDTSDHLVLTFNMAIDVENRKAITLDFIG